MGKVDLEAFEKMVRGHIMMMEALLDQIASQRSHNGTCESVDGWITQTDAAQMLLASFPMRDIDSCRSSVSRAGKDGRFQVKGDGKEKRIEETSFRSWLLAQRDKDLEGAV